MNIPRLNRLLTKSYLTCILPATRLTFFCTLCAVKSFANLSKGCALRLFFSFTLEFASCSTAFLREAKLQLLSLLYMFSIT